MTRCPRCGRPAELACVDGDPLPGVQLIACSCVPLGVLVVATNGWRARVGRRLADTLAGLSKAVGQ